MIDTYSAPPVLRLRAKGAHALCPPPFVGTLIALGFLIAPAAVLSQQAAVAPKPVVVGSTPAVVADAAKKAPSAAPLGPVPGSAVPAPAVATPAPAQVDQQGLTPMTVNDMYSGKLTPAEIADVKKREIQREEAAARVTITGDVIPKSISLDLQGISKTHSVRIAQGFGTSIVFIDATGMPWPIRRIDNFNSQALSLLGIDAQSAANKDCRTDTVNSFSVFAKSRFDAGVINVFLCDAPVPVVFNFNSDVKAKDVDNPVEVRVATKGPLAKLDPVVFDGRPTYSGTLLALLDGQVPAFATPLHSAHPGVRAWNVGPMSDRNGNARILVKTSLSVFSPAPIESRSGANGVSAYLMPATPVLLVSDSTGRIVSVVLADSPQ